MFVRSMLAAFCFMMVQAVLFGIGVILVLATPLSDLAWTLMPWVTGVTSVMALPISWKIATDLQTRPECERAEQISGKYAEQH